MVSVRAPNSCCFSLMEAFEYSVSYLNLKLSTSVFPFPLFNSSSFKMGNEVEAVTNP